MKYIGLCGILCFVYIYSCGQAHHKRGQVSNIDSATIKALEYKSIIYQERQPDSAIYFAEQGLRLSRKLHYYAGEALMLNRFARINEQYGHLQMAIKYEQQAIFIYHKLHDTIAIANTMVDLGSLEARQEHYDTGIQLIKTALLQFQKSRNRAGIIKVYTRLGELSEHTGNGGMALKYYFQAEELYKSMPVSEEYFALINSIGRVYTRLGNHMEANNYYETGIEKSRGTPHVKAHIAFLNKAGKTHHHLDNKEKALAYHQQSLEKARQHGLPEEEAHSLIHIATTIKNDDAETSIKHLKNALAISDSIGHKRLSAEIYLSLSSIYKQQQRHLEALTAWEEHHRLLDSLLEANENHKLDVLQKSYELVESKLHIETLELTNKQKTHQRNLGILLASATLLILLILARYFYKTSRLNKKLESSNQVKDKLFTIIGHDLRNPIGGITQLLAIMENETLTPQEYQQMIAEMKKQGDVTLEILNALLNWGEAQLKGIHIKASTFNSKETIQKNIHALHKQAADKSITVTDDTPPTLSIYGDPNHFDFIIRNLLSNAIKFSYADGTIAIAADDRSAVGYVTFSVKDNGKGISKAQQELFIKSNLDIAFGTKGEKGTGIGLMLCKEFIKANKGRIWIVSEEGKGTTFYFTFPRSTA